MRVRLWTLLRIELALVLCALLLAWAVEPMRANFAHASAVTFLLFLFHFAVVPLRGYDFVIYDESPTSPYKYYFFGSIAASAFAGGFVSTAALRAMGLPSVGL